jgi:hypothetical protein
MLELMSIFFSSLGVDRTFASIAAFSKLASIQTFAAPTLQAGTETGGQGRQRGTERQFAAAARRSVSNLPLDPIDCPLVLNSDFTCAQEGIGAVFSS